MAMKLLTFNTPWKEFRVEIRNEALYALGEKKKLQKRPSDSWHFGEEIFMTPDSCIFSNLEKH